MMSRSPRIIISPQSSSTSLMSGDAGVAGGCATEMARLNVVALIAAKAGDRAVTSTAALMSATEASIRRGGNQAIVVNVEKAAAMAYASAG